MLGIQNHPLNLCPNSGDSSRCLILIVTVNLNALCVANKLLAVTDHCRQQRFGQIMPVQSLASKRILSSEEEGLLSVQTKAPIIVVENKHE